MKYNDPERGLSTNRQTWESYNGAMPPILSTCWKCSSSNIQESLLRVGRLRTTEEAIQQGATDYNTYQRFIVCQDCEYRWFPHMDRYLRQIVYRRERNEKIADLCVRFAKAKQSCFVYVGLVEHAELLGLLLKNAFMDARLDPVLCAVVNGRLDDEYNGLVKKALNEGRILCVVGTSVWGEGTNIPTLRWVINAKAGKAGTELEQLIGRALRRPEGKYRAGFVDFKDDHDKTFAARSRSRQASLAAEGFKPRVLAPCPAKNKHRKYRR